MMFVIEIALPFLFYAPFKQLRRIAAYGQVIFDLEYALASIENICSFENSRLL